MANWQPIETAPKDGTLLLLYSNTEYYKEVVFGSWRCDNSDYEESEPMWLDTSYDDWSIGLNSCPLYPTHWMPVPEPPNDQEI